MSILDGLKKSSDIKNLGLEELKTLSEEIRSKIIDTVSDNGGHLSPNLGITDLTVALYRVFDFPKDKLIFDVGHQCYAHKILSDRKDSFSSIRKDGGISGFPDRSESVYDAFGVGHSGTSLSAGLGLCCARDKIGEKENVIVVVGDASIANGLNLEALTSSTSKPKNLIVILNDNGMSISANKNGLYQMLSKRTTKGSYLKSKNAIKKLFGNSFIAKFLSKVHNFIKHVISRDDYFSSFGFKYVGVVDGNDMKDLVKILQRIKLVADSKAVLLHINTQKGKGLKSAEDHADLYHGVGKKLKTSCGKFAIQLGKTINNLIEQDSSVVAITAGMKSGTGLDIVEEEHKANFYDVGIAEEYAVTFASGLAVGGLKPIVAIYSTFMQRAYDQVLHDVCIQNLPVVFCMDRAGFVGEDGKTHQGLFDLSFLSQLPNMKIIAPNSMYELDDAIKYAISLNSPVAIRYPKSCEEDIVTPSLFKSLWVEVNSLLDYEVVVLAVGPNMRKLALEYASLSDKKVRIVSARTVKPLDESLLDNIKENSLIITLEENVLIGGFGSIITSYFSNKNVNTISIGVDDKFICHGSVNSQLAKCGLTAQNILEKEKEFFNKLV